MGRGEGGETAELDGLVHECSPSLVVIVIGPLLALPTVWTDNHSGMVESILVSLVNAARAHPCRPV